MSNMVRLGAVYLVIITAIFLVSCTKSPPELFEDARQQELRGDIVGATLTLMSALQLDPNNGVMRFMLGRLYNAQFEPTKAEGELKKARKAGVIEGGRLAVELGRALRYQGKFSEVLKLAVPDNSFEKDQLAQVFALRGRAQNALALSEDAYESLAQATKLDANDSDVLLLRAVLDADKSDFDGALSIINQALERNPRHFESRQVKAEILRAMGKVDDSLVAYAAILDLNPRDFRALATRTTLLLRLRKFEAAKKDINQLVKVYGNDPRALTLLGAWQLETAKPDLALDSARAALKSNADFSDAKLLAGLAHRALGSDLQADEFLTKYLIGNPKSLFARKALSETLLKTNQAARALEVLQPVIDSGTTEDPRLATLVGDAYMRVGNDKKAMQWLDLAVAAGPKDPRARVMHALGNLATKGEDIGFEELSSALSLTPGASATDEMLVLALLYRKQIERAVKVVDKLEKRAPGSPITSNLKGLVLLAKGEQSGAINEFQAALKGAPDFYPAALNLAQLDVAAGRPEAARQRFESVLNADGKNLQAMLAIVDIHLKLKQTAEAIKMLERAIQAWPKNLAPRSILAALYRAQGDKQKALSVAEDALAINPGDLQAIVLAAVAQLEAGDANKAVTTYAELLHVLPDIEKAHIKVAEFEMMAGMPREAEATLRSSLAKHSTPAVQISLVSLLVSQQRTDDAMNIARQAQKDQPNAPFGYVLEGEVNEALKKYLDAVVAYEKALSFQPVGQLAVKRYFARTRAGDPQGALSQLEAWSGEHAEDVVALGEIGNALMKAGNYKAAAATYERVIKHKEVSSDVVNNLALAYHQLKDPRAKGMAAAAYQAAPNSPVVADTLGWLLVEDVDGNLTRGLEILKRASGLAPDNLDISYHLASALVKSGDTSQAKEVLVKLLASNTEFASRSDAERLLGSIK